MSPSGPWRPTAEQVAAAAGGRLADLLGPGLDIVFCGVNPGLYSAAAGHHFARPGNRFWLALFQAGITESLVSPFDDASLLDQGLGFTNLVARATGAASELSAAELRDGAAALEAKVARCAPRAVAVLGLQAYRTAFGRPAAVAGPQPEAIGRARLWLVPNPSGLQARYPLPTIVAGLRELRASIQR